MPSEEKATEPAPEEGVPEGKVPRRFSRKQLRIFALVAVVAVIVVILLWGMVPERIYEVRNVFDEIDDLDGEYINVKGVVVSWESGQNNYTMADTDDANLTIEAVHKGGFPEGFGMDATVVAKGIVKRSGLVISMDTDVIQIGCPSKY